MLELFIVIVRGLALALRGHQELVFENLALRQRLMSIKRATKRHRVEARDRLFWIALARCRRWCRCSPRPLCGGIATGDLSGRR
jgi:hypothetical protein